MKSFNTKGKPVCPGCSYYELQDKEEVCYQCISKADGVVASMEELEKLIKSVDNLSHFYYMKSIKNDLQNASLYLMRTRDNVKSSKDYKIDMMQKYNIKYDL